MDNTRYQNNKFKLLNPEHEKVLFAVGDIKENEIKEDNNEFMDFFLSRLSDQKSIIISNTILNARVCKIKANDIIVDINLKNYGKLNKNELREGTNIIDISVGDVIQVVADSIDAQSGSYIKVSWEKAKRLILWEKFQQCMNEKTVLYGAILNEARGGYVGNIQGVEVFIPGSHVDFRPPEKRLIETMRLSEQPFIILSMEKDATKDNIVVSRREVLNLERIKIKDVAINRIKVGDVLHGTVKSIAPYGCFVNLQIPGDDEITVDGLLHLNDMNWNKISHPSEMVSLGDELKVFVVSLMPEERKISLGLKQLTNSPWKNITARFSVGMKVKGIITSVTDYGYFVKIADGVEGLIHLSEVSWTKNNIKLKSGKEVEALILTVDEEKMRISLSLKQCGENPWQIFANNNKPGSLIKVRVKNVADFGIITSFVLNEIESNDETESEGGENGEIEGVIYVADISWENDAQQFLSNLSVGKILDVKVLSVNPERSKISLGIKQLKRDYFEEFMNSAKTGDIIQNCTIHGAWNDRLDIEIPPAKTIVRIENTDLPSDYAQEKWGKYAKNKTITCKIKDINKEMRKISFEIL